MKRALWLVLALLLALLPALADEEVSLFPAPSLPASAQPTPQATPLPGDPSAREAFIDGMLALARELFTKAGGRAQPASSAGDIYVCKNFTVYLFRQNRDGYRMAAFPDVPLVIPNNLPASLSKPYAYGIAWEDVAAEAGNPFYAAHSFYYDPALGKGENRERALAFMRQVRRGDFFQMSADYYYGIGAHSAVFTRDFDPAGELVYWTDANMKGETRGGKRFGYVQYDAIKGIDWFVEAFCKKGRGATLYRLREDIIKK
ncbi:MAG: hypothetical protein AB9880_07395 [Christensenellales bacterium]